MSAILPALLALRTSLEAAAAALDAAIAAATDAEQSPDVTDEGPVVLEEPEAPVTTNPTPTPALNTRVDAFGPAELATKAKGAKPGDTIVARKGLYGVFGLSAVARGGRFSILSEAGATFERFTLNGCKDITLDGIEAFPDKSNPLPNAAIISGDAGSTGIFVINSKVSSAIDADDYLNWSKTRWQARKTRGITLEGMGCAIRDVLLVGLGIGAIIGAPGSEMVRVKVRGFSEDAMRARGNGNGWLIEDPDIANAITISTAHCDAIQCWSMTPGGAAGTGLMSGLRVIRPKMREWIGNPSHPLRAVMQGVGLHDGTYDAPFVDGAEYWGRSVWGVHIGACKTPGTVQNSRAYHIDRINTDRPRIGGNVGTSVKNVANKFTYTKSATDEVAAYTGAKAAPVMSLVD